MIRLSVLIAAATTAGTFFLPLPARADDAAVVPGWDLRDGVWVPDEPYVAASRARRVCRRPFHRCGRSTRIR